MSGQNNFCATSFLAGIGFYALVNGDVIKTDSFLGRSTDKLTTYWKTYILPYWNEVYTYVVSKNFIKYALYTGIIVFVIYIIIGFSAEIFKEYHKADEYRENMKRKYEKRSKTLDSE